MKTCRLLRLPEVIEITGLGRDTIYRVGPLAENEQLLAPTDLVLHSPVEGIEVSG